MEKDVEIGSIICSRKQRYEIYSNREKTLKQYSSLPTESDSGKIYLSEFAVKDRFIKIDSTDQIKKPVVSRLYTKITDTVHKS